jgi:hypothetical protein
MMKFNVNGNAFVERTIPSELFRCRNLFKLALCRTSLGGTIPAGFANLTELAFVALDTAVLGDAGNHVAELLPHEPWKKPCRRCLLTSTLPIPTLGISSGQVLSAFHNSGGRLKR